jgi:hypothetical protein
MADDTRYELTPEFVDEWNRIRAKVDGMTGDGVHNSQTSLSHTQEPEGNDPHHHFQFVYVRIDGPTDDNGDGRYLGTPYTGGTNPAPTDITPDDLGVIDDNAKQLEVWNIPEMTGLFDGPLLNDGEPVAAWPGGFNTDTQMPIYFTYSTGEGVGQYAGQYHQVGSNNKGTWDMVRAASMPLPPT